MRTLPRHPSPRGTAASRPTSASMWNDASAPAGVAVITGAAGAVVSISTIRSADAADTLPARSVAVAR